MDTLDFNFEGDSGLFGGFQPDISSLQAQETKTEENQTIINDQRTIKDTNLLDKKEVSDEETDDNDVIEGEPDEVDNSNQSDKKEENEEYEYSYKEIANHLSDIGLLTQLDEDVEDSPEALEIAVSNTIESKISEYKNSIPETGKLFLDYLEQGGDPSKFLETLEKPIDYKNIDLSNEDNQKLIIREYLKHLDYSKEEIEEELNDYEDGLLLEKKSKSFSTKLEKIHSQKQVELLKEQELANQESQKQIEEYFNNVKTTIQNSTNIAGLEVSASDKLEFEKYLLQTDKEGLTKYQKEVNENPLQTQLELAYLKFKKYDFSKVAKEIKTAEAKTFRKFIRNTDKTISSSAQVDSRSDLGSLDGFKRFV